MPFITEEIACNVQSEEESIMISSWPEYKAEWNFEADENAVETIKAEVLVTHPKCSRRNECTSKQKAKVVVVSENEAVREIFATSRVFFATLAYASEVAVQSDKNGIGDDAVSAVIHDAVIYMPFAELVDIEKEIERLTKEKEKLGKEIARCTGMLGNPNFVNKAPQRPKIAAEKEKLEKYTNMFKQCENHAVLK